MLNPDEHSPPPPPPLAMKNLQAKTTMDLPEPSGSPLSIKGSPLLPRRTPSPHRTRSRTPSPSSVSKSPTVSQRNKKAPAAAAAAAGLKLRSLVTVWRFVKRTYNRTRRTSPLPDKELRISVVGNLVKNCTETFLSEEGTVRGSSVGDTESNFSAARRFSSDSGNSSGEEYPYFIGKQCREYLDNPSNVSRG